MQNQYLSLGALGLAVIAILITLSMGSASAHKTLADRAVASGTIRVGYIVYPPSLIKDPNTGKLSGISYDIVNAAAKNLGLKTEWVEEVGWDTAIEGLHTNRYDVVGTMVWLNSKRAREAGLSTPAAYSAVYTYTRAGNMQFDGNVASLNSPSHTIATVDGEMTSFITKTDFPNAKTYSLPQTASLSEALLGVTSGKADVTFVEPAVARGFLTNNPGAIRQVGTTPIRTLANVFLVNRGEDTFLGMWNGAIDEIVADGTVASIMDKYAAKDSYLPVASPVGAKW